ncbi:MAG: SMC-Scp complex subunit ScpB [Anaerolineales bacterium]|nr:SMC-Scp complex subunit ScpB [Anaerolineales bacterium]
MNDAFESEKTPPAGAVETPGGASGDETAAETGAASAAETAVETPANLPALLEALLFVAPGEVNPSQLAAALDLPLAAVERGLEALADEYTRPAARRGLRLQRHRGRVQLTSAPAAGPYVERFLGLEASSRLSRAALEALAIVLYQQPVTRPQIEAIRGVNSDGVVHSLLLRGLIQEVGRAEAPGRPILYSSTSECLQYFGLSSLAELPPLDLDEGEPEPPVEL